MATRKTIEARISNLELKVVSSKKTKGETKHAITCEIIWPRPTISSKTYAKIITLKDKKLFADSVNDWLNTILFKETTEGTFGIKLSISRALSNSELSSFMKTLLKTTLTASAGVVDDHIENEFLSDMLQGILKYGANEIVAANERQVAATECVCDTREITLAKSSGVDLILELKAPNEWNINSSAAPSPTKGTRPSRRSVKLLAKGANNGSITIHFVAS